MAQPCATPVAKVIEWRDLPGMPKERKSDTKMNHPRQQFAALPIIIRDGETMVMLVTSRETHRWVPKALRRWCGWYVRAGLSQLMHGIFPNRST